MTDGVIDVLVTIDTEPDDLWSKPGTISFDHLPMLRQLQELCRRHGLQPTYLVTHCVAGHPPSAAVLNELLQAGDCEIGAHLHAWTTPPEHDLDRRTTTVYPYLYEYPVETQRAKLRRLVDQIGESFGVSPRSYRAGRWGLDSTSLDLLEELGFIVDSTVTPWFSWRERPGLTPGVTGPSFVSATLHPYHPGSGDPSLPGNRAILEVPVTTSLYGPLARGPFAPARDLWARGDRLARGIRRVLDRTRLARTLWLRPQVCSPDEMLALSRQVIAGGVPLLNIMFHSSELGDTRYGRQGGLLTALDAFLTALAGERPFRGATLTGFAEAWNASN